MTQRAVFWDFDGTLAVRDGMWGGCLLSVLDAHQPDHQVGIEDLRPHLAAGFPWHDAERPHPELNDPDAWWAAVAEVIAAAYEGVGYAKTRAAGLAACVREEFVDPDRWRVFDDALPVLSRLRDEGWRHVIVSNHVPELPELVAQLGLRDLVDEVITSAAVGYDKPHPAIFAVALEVAGSPNQVWMVGDSPTADVAGAEGCQIPAILVRRDAPARYRASGLHEAADLIMGSTDDDPIRR